MHRIKVSLRLVQRRVTATSTVWGSGDGEGQRRKIGVLTVGEDRTMTSMRLTRS